MISEREPPGSATMDDDDADASDRSMSSEDTASSQEPSLTDLEGAAAQQALAHGWECDLCFESHGQHETLWCLVDPQCGHSFCIRCVRGSIQWGGRCPYDNTPIPPIVVCGVMGMGEYTFHEKREKANKTGGIMCSGWDCPGVAPACEDHPPQFVECPVCPRLHCGRGICSTPWTEGHRCWDIVEEEQRLAEERRAEQRGLDYEERRRLVEDLRRAHITRQAVYMELQRAQSEAGTPEGVESAQQELQRAEEEVWRTELMVRRLYNAEDADLSEPGLRIIASVQSTTRRLASAPRFRPCPTCGAMVEHWGGCNMVYHESCRTAWCFVCRSVGTCSDYDCKAPSS
mmetsp:Transcript_57543/g.124414  ORF Transcript_57543/g.124414 Transcript_57543/m.124414 type:complete len:344 (+) Transcript_57543:3-1034(+)